MFSEYVNHFLKIKQESSGFPDWVKTHEDKVKYVNDYYEHEGIHLRIDKIKYNPGLRAFAKLCLNSLWGKFCQKDDRLNTEFVNDPLHFYRRLNGADVDMHDLCILNDDLVELVFKRKHEYAVENKLTNIFIGIFTTAWARLELYNLLDLLGENALYVDTDSCIFVSREGSPKPATGDYLGQLTNEITPKHGEASYITRFACGGPKNYAYVVNNGKKHCKIRGFTLNFKNSQILNFDSMRNAICKYVRSTIGSSDKKNKENVFSLDIVNQCKITREKWTRRLVNKREVKSYQVVYDKRIVLGNGEDTIPFGFNWSHELAEQLLADNKNIPLRSYVSHGSVPDDILYTNIQPFMEDNARLTDIQSMEADKTISSASIDLMESDSEHETSTDYSSENSIDRDFVDDDILSDEDVSFYRHFNSIL